MTNPRDIFLQQFKPALDDKENRYPPFRAVLTSSAGATDTGDVWKDENARLVWFRAWGGAAPAWALCDVLEPTLGLGVYIKFNPDINQYEVLRDDPLMRSPSSDRTSYRAITDQDLLKGGRFQLWLDPTMFIPLSIYPTAADTVNVVSGDYILGGERLTFAGAVGQDLSASRPAVGFHRFVGFYLDDTATLATIDGATVATGTDAIEPVWPAGVLRVGVVDIDNATAISIDNIDNRKVIYTEDDETGAINVWPRADEVNINFTPYAGWALAVDALDAGEQAIIGEGTYLSDNERIDVAAFIKGSGVDVSILSTTTKDRALELATDPIILEDFTLSNIYTATLYGDYYAAFIDENASIDAFRVKFVVTGSGGNINYGCYIASAGTHRFAECIWDVRNGTANYALYMDAQGLYSGAVVDLFDPDITGNVHNEDGTLKIHSGIIDGDVYAGDGATINLYNPVITGTVTSHAGGTINGDYQDNDGNIITNRTAQAAWFDFPLFDTTDAAGIASNFRDNDNEFPEGWTQIDAAAQRNTNELYSFWYLRGTNANTTWKYRIQQDLDFEATGGDITFQAGPILFRDGKYTADLHYRFGIYADDGAGAIDETVYVRIDLYWNNASSVWQVRGEESDGSTPHTGSYISLPTIPIQPIWIRNTLRMDFSKIARIYFGYTNVPKSHTLLLQQTPSSTPAWDQGWLQFEMTRGAGIFDYLFIGSIDYLAGEP